MNELANVAQAYGADIAEVAKVSCGQPSRFHLFISRAWFRWILFAKDMVACVQFAAREGITCDMLEAITSVNERQIKVSRTRSCRTTAQNGPKRIAIWG